MVSKAANVKIGGLTEMSFTVKGFINPIEATLVDGFKIQTAILSGTDFYFIDEGFAQMSVAEWATLTRPTITVLDEGAADAGMVQEMNDMQLNFYLPVPVNKGCILKVFLPEEYSVNDINTVVTKNAFG